MSASIELSISHIERPSYRNGLAHKIILAGSCKRVFNQAPCSVRLKVYSDVYGKQLYE